MFSNLQDYVTNLNENNRDLRQDILMQSKDIKVSEPGRRIFNPDLNGISFHKSTIVLPNDTTVLDNKEYIIDPKEYVYNVKDLTQRNRVIMGEILRRDVQEENDKKRVLRDPTEMPQSEIRVDYNKLKLNNMDNEPLPYMAGMNSESYKFDERMQTKSPIRDVDPITRLHLTQKLKKEEEEKELNTELKPAKKLSYDELDTTFNPEYYIDYIKKENIYKNSLKHQITEEEINDNAHKDSFKTDVQYMEKPIQNKRDYQVNPKGTDDPDRLYNEFINSLGFDINDVLNPRIVPKESRRKLTNVDDSEIEFPFVEVPEQRRIIYYPEGMIIHRENDDVDENKTKYAVTDYENEVKNRQNNKRDVLTLHKEGLDDERIEFFVSTNGDSNIRQTAFVRDNVLHVIKKPLKHADDPVYMYEIPLTEIDRRFSEKYHITKNDDRQLKLDFNDSKDLFEFTQNMQPVRILTKDSMKIMQDNPSKEFVDYSVDMPSLTENKRIVNVKDKYNKEIKLDVDSKEGIVSNAEEEKRLHKFKQNSLRKGVDKQKLNKMWNDDIYSME